MPHSISRRTRSLAAAVVLAAVTLAATACNESPTASDAGFTASVSPASPTTTLGTTTTYTITIQSQDYTGPVNVSVSGHPASWVVTAATPSTVNVTAGGSATVTITVQIPSNGEAAPSGRTLTFKVGGNGSILSGTSKLTVKKEYVLAIPAGAGAAGPHWSVTSPLLLKSGTLLRIRNDDATAHRIHTNGTIPGLAPQDASMTQGQSYTATVGVGTDVIYCADHGDTTGQLTITVQP